MKNKTIASLSLRKLLLSVLVTAPLATLPVPLWALPANQSALDTQINSKSAGVTVTSNSGTSVTVDATQTNSIIRWNNFGATGMTINGGDTITYNMPSSSSAVLNTVTGTNPTVINGTLTTGTNGGSIWVQNPNGITVGSTGVINATNIGLSTVPESEFYFSANGKLQFSENTSNSGGPVLTSSGVLLDGGTLTAASGTGNVWIAGKGVAASGTIDAGNTTITGFQGGAITLAPAAGVTVPTMVGGVANTATATGGALTIGDVTNLNATLTVTQTTAGQIAIDKDQNLTVYGPSVSLNAGNQTITQAAGGTGHFIIGAGGTNGATLTLNSGDHDTTISDVQSAGTGALNVTATGANITVKDGGSTGKLAISATGTSLTTQTGGDLTINPGNVSTGLTATSVNGSILSGGTTIVGGTAAVSLNATTAGKNITFHVATAPTPALTIGTNATGTVTLTADAGTLKLPAITAKNITVSAGNVTTPDSATVSASGTLSLTATAGNVNIGTTTSSALSGGTVTLWASDSIKSATSASISSAGAVTLTGNTGNVDTTNLTISGSPTDVSLTAGKAVTIGSAIAAGNVTANAGTTLTQTGTVDSTGSGGSIRYTSSGDLSVGNSIGATTAPKTISLSSASGNITIGGNLNTQASGAITATAAGNVTNNVVVTSSGGTVTLTSNGGNVTSGTITAGNIALSAGKTISINGGQNVTGTYSAAAGTGDVVQDAVILGIPNPSSVTLSSTSGNVSIGHSGGATISAGNVSVTAGAKIVVGQTVTTTTGANLSATGNVDVSAGLIAPTLSITGAYINGAGPVTSTGTTTLTSTDKISLPGTNDFNIVVVKGAPNGATINDNSGGIILGGGTAATGNLTLSATSGNITLGNASTDVITVAKEVSLTTTTSGAIQDTSDNIAFNTASGNTTLSSAGVITLDGSTGHGTGLNNSFGRVVITATGGDVTLAENTTLNLGDLTLGSKNLTAYSKSSIINTGVINTSGTVTVGAGTATAPGTINLDYNDSTNGTNKISGTIGLLTDLGLFGQNSLGTYLASRITVVNGVANGNLFSLTGTTDVGVQGVNVDLTTTGSVPLNVGTVATNGTLNLTSGTGAINAPSLTVSALTVKSGGAVAVTNTKDLTVNGNISGTGTAAYTATGNLTIGSYVSSTTGSTTFTGTGGAVTDSVTGISIYGPVTFSGKSVSVTKAGHSFGPVSVTTTGNGDASVVESGYLNLGTIAIGSGTLTASSTNGGVLQTGSLAAGNVTVTAPKGTISLNNASNAIGGWVSTTSSGNTTIVNNAALTLGSITTTGNLSIDTSSASGNITQASDSSIYSYGATSFKSAGTGAIMLTNSGNRFGGLTLTTGSGAIKVTEQTTMNLKKVSTSGALTATSTDGSIVDSQAADADINVGSATLTASSVNISAKKATIATVVGNATAGDFTLNTGAGLTATVNATGNATLNTGGALVFNASTVGGNLSVHGTTSTIDQLGGLNVAGNVILWATDAITLNDATNQFGPVQLHTAAGKIASITEAGTFNLLAGTVAQGQVVITTGGDFITSGTGGSSFTGGTGADAAHAGLIVHAPNGTITFGAGSVVVTNGLTVDATGTKDLSQLSKAGNLNGKDPFNIGSGTLIPPSTP